MSLRAALELFDEVVDATPADREAALASAPPEVAEVVRSMLSADASSFRFQTGGAGLLVAQALPRGPTLPPRIPGFDVLGLLGEGGMGQVFEAEQHSPRRRVALKMVQPWLVSGGSIARLRFEAEALAALLHPGIPQVYAVGEHDQQVFLVLERVEGAPLREAAATRPTRGKVELLARVADAVAHAHARGFLHLDLKPGNVLVTAEGQPKVLDFGLARGTASAEDGPSGGTPAYMAPEQEAGERVDVRADVYGLGVVMWELLRGERPARGAIAPLDAGHPALAGDLAAIVAQATAPDPARRTPTMEALAADLHAWLEHRPVVARRGGPLYVLGKALRRRPAVWGLAAAALLSAGVGLAVSLERAQAAEAAQEAAEVALAQAEAARGQAEAEARRARASVGLLTDVFLELDPRLTSGKTTLLEAALQAAQRLDAGALAEAPTEAALMRIRLAEALINQGREVEARALCEGVLTAAAAPGADLDGHEIDAHQLLAWLDRDARKNASAQEHLKTALAQAAARGDLEREAELIHDEAALMSDMGDPKGAGERFALALEKKRALGEALDPLSLLPTLSQLGGVRAGEGRFAEARALFEEQRQLATKLDAGHDLALVDHWLARVSLDEGKPEAALVHLDAALARRDALGLGSAAANRSGEAQLRTEILLALGRYDEAAPLLAPLLAQRGTDEPPYRRDALLLADWLLHAGRAAEADAVIQAAYEDDADGKPGSGSWAWAHTVRGLWRARRGVDGAAADLDEALSVWEPRYGPDGPRVVEVRRAREALGGRPPG